MKNYQDTETGQIYAFDDGIDPFTLNNRNIPTTLSEMVIPKPDENHVWFRGGWIERACAPDGYKSPTSSVPSYNPAWISFLNPYTFVLPDGVEFSVSLEQINENSYAGERLSAAVAVLPLKGADGMPGLVSFDGAIAIPMCVEFVSHQRAVEEMNQLLCSILIGGVHTEVVGARELLTGSLQDGENLFVYHPTQHSRFRHMNASIAERIQLMHPRVVRASNLQQAYLQGLSVIDAIKNFSPFFLLHGYTALFHQNRSDALGSLWIVVEQLTSFLWERRFLAAPHLHPTNMKNRLQGLKQDNRTWSTSVKHELLWQAKVLSEECFSRLFAARSQRNKLVHEGAVPDFAVVAGVWLGICELLEKATDHPLAKLRELTPLEYPKLTAPAKVNFDEWATLVSKFNVTNDAVPQTS